MTDPALHIAQSEPASLRLFHIDAADPRGRILAEAPTPATIAASLGLPSVAPLSTEVVRLADIAPLGLRNYLTQAYDVLPESLDHGTGLAALTGHVLIVQSSLAAGGAVTLNPGASLRLVGVFAQREAAATLLQMPEPPRSLAPGQTPPPKTPDRGGGASVLRVLVVVAILVAIGAALLRYAR